MTTAATNNKSKIKSPKSPYSKMMQEAMMSKNDNKKGLAVDTTSANNEGGEEEEREMGYTVELFPVEFHYVIATPDDTNNGATSGVGGGSSSNNNNNNSKGDSNPNNNANSKNNKKELRGIALASRQSSIHTVLSELQRIATPSRARSCTTIDQAFYYNY